MGRRYGILTQAWSPIGGITFYRDSKHTSTLEDPVVLAIAKAHSESAAQVMLRWHLQEGRSVIPKSIKPERIAENIDVFDFELTPLGSAANRLAGPTFRAAAQVKGVRGALNRENS